MKRRQFSRRDFFYLCVGGGVLAAGYPLARAISQSSRGAKGAKALRPTPGNTLGPFYKSGAPKRERLIEQAGVGAIPLMVAGRVLNTEGKPLPSAKVEVFHADHAGEYDLEGFRYRGEIPVDAGGQYRFESVVPGHYGGRARHVHYVITAPGHAQLVTQLYFENDTVFEGNPDRNYSRDSLVQHRELIRPVGSAVKEGVTYSSVVFDICLEKQ